MGQYVASAVSVHIGVAVTAVDGVLEELLLLILALGLMESDDEDVVDKLLKFE